MVWRQTAAMLLLLFAGCGFARAQQPGGQQPKTSLPKREAACTISGRVLYAQNFQAVESVLVKLMDRGIPRDQTFTRSSGRFEFPSLPQRDFVVEVKADGYKPARVSVDLSFSCRNVSTTILLERENVVAVQASREPTVSAEELQIPGKARKAFARGARELHKKERPERSLKHFRKAIELYPDYDQAYIQLGLAHLALDQGQEAQQVLETATTVNKENVRAFVLLGMVHGKQGHVNDSVRALKEAVRLDENDWLAHFELSRTLLQQGLTHDGYSHAQRAHQLNPQSPNVHLLLYDACMQRQDYETALAEVEEFLELFPESALAPKARQQVDALRRALAAKVD